MSKNKAYAIGLIMTLAGSANMVTSFISAVMFSVGFLLIIYSYADMIVHKDTDPFKYL